MIPIAPTEMNHPSGVTGHRCWTHFPPSTKLHSSDSDETLLAAPHAALARRIRYLEQRRTGKPTLKAPKGRQALRYTLRKTAAQYLFGRVTASSGAPSPATFGTNPKWIATLSGKPVLHSDPNENADDFISRNLFEFRTNALISPSAQLTSVEEAVTKHLTPHIPLMCHARTELDQANKNWNELMLQWRELPPERRPQEIGNPATWIFPDPADAARHSAAVRHLLAAEQVWQHMTQYYPNFTKTWYDRNQQVVQWPSEWSAHIRAGILPPVPEHFRPVLHNSDGSNQPLNTKPSLEELKDAQAALR